MSEPPGSPARRHHSEVRVTPEQDALIRQAANFEVALHTGYLFPTCDAETLRVHLNSGGPVPPKENPAAGRR